MIKKIEKWIPIDIVVCDYCDKEIITVNTCVICGKHICAKCTNYCEYFGKDEWKPYCPCCAEIKDKYEEPLMLLKEEYKARKKDLHQMWIDQSEALYKKEKLDIQEYKNAQWQLKTLFKKQYQQINGFLCEKCGQDLCECDKLVKKEDIQEVPCSCELCECDKPVKKEDIQEDFTEEWAEACKPKVELACLFMDKEICPVPECEYFNHCPFKKTDTEPKIYKGEFSVPLEVNKEQIMESIRKLITKLKKNQKNQGVLHSGGERPNRPLIAPEESIYGDK